MNPIRITEFFDYDKVSFLEFLQLNRAESLIVCLPKDSSMHEGETCLSDYYRLLYVLHTLESITHEVFYTCPDPFQTGEFQLIIYPKDFDQLAAYLWEVTQGYNYMTDAFIDFEIECTQAETYLRKDPKGSNLKLYKFILEMHAKFEKEE
jgi:hypothetical protein